MIYISVPFYNEKSNGISVVYALVGILNRSGIPARILCTENERYDVSIPEDIKSYYVSKAGVPAKMKDDDIIFYLDTADNKYIQAKHVVYWLLNKPGMLTGESLHFQPEDILVAFSSLVHPQLPQLFLLKDDRELFNAIRNICKKSANTVSIYFGKVNEQLVLDKNPQLKELINQYTQVNVITRQSPAKRLVTLQLIAQSDLLISYDALSNLNYEATLLGTPVLMMDDVYGLANITYNVGNFGFAFSKEEINKARAQVNKAFETYCAYLEKQDETVIFSMRQIIDKVSRVESDSEALTENALINQSAEKDFAAFYERQKVPFKNVDFVNDIPSETRRIIPKSSLKSACLNTKAAIDIEPEADEQTSLKRRLYAMLKPTWVDSMYRKIPGNLKFYELLFLMFRRMFVWWKK